MLTRPPQSETLPPTERGLKARDATMMRTSAILFGLCAGAIALAMPGGARAETPAVATTSQARTSGPMVQDFSAQSRRVIRRAPRRVPVYRGSNYPGPNSVRVCNAYYEQEYRPSGTVIVPRMNCHWRG